MPFFRTSTKLTPSLCEKYAGCIFVFGDNMQRRGKKGQSVIRDCANAYGIPTKWYPTLHPTAMFSDRDDEIQIVMEHLEHVDKLLSKGHNVVWPETGIGTGLAKWQENCPKLLHLTQLYVNRWEYLYGETSVHF